ncbi:cytochrome P450 [Favolaschia claudopus]|uniref:Cytochrome P450 n=1 Tax=Favolaschia claudopus TaxID=2862362 RepID=A0AAW0CI39_9AGAR
MSLPPGLLYLAHQLPRLLALPLGVYCLTLVAERLFDVAVPRWLAAALCLSSGPIVLTILVQYRDWKHRREAAAQGAVMAPNLPGWIGGLQILFTETADMYPGEGLVAMTEKLGTTVNARFMFQNRIVTTEPENIKAMLATEFATFEKGPIFRNSVAPLLGSGVFASDGDMWKFHRQMTRPFFNRDRISDFDLFDLHSANAIAQVKTRLREGYAVDFQDMVSRFTMDTATSFLFGKNVHSLEQGLPYPHNAGLRSSITPEPSTPIDFATCFQQAQMTLSLRSRLGANWPLQELFAVTDKLQPPLKVVREFLQPILRDAVANKKMREGVEEEEDKLNNADRHVKEGETMLEHLVNYTDDQTILRDEILNITLAGRDTTASLLTFTVYKLAEHPQIFAKAREEILRVVGSTGRPTFEHLRDMKYLRAVLNETLRLFPPVPFNERTATQPTIFRPSKATGGPPIYIPAGTRCIYSVMVSHRRKDLWGPDALEFDPERWFDERLHKYLIPDPFIFLPFNAGPRICLGQQFAYHEASFFLVRLLQAFSTISLDLNAQPAFARPPTSWQVDDESGWKASEKVRPRSHFTLFIHGGLWVKMEEAQSGDDV